MTTPEFVRTTLTEHKLIGSEAIDEARMLRQMFHTASLAELLAIVSHNAQHARIIERFFDGPFPIGELDQTSLVSRGIILSNKVRNRARSFGNNEYPLPEFTTRGIVAINLYALDENRLDEGALKPVLREPFNDFSLLRGTPDISSDID